MRRRPLQLTTMFAAATLFAAQAMPPLGACCAATAGVASCKNSCCGQRSQDAAGAARACACSPTSRSVPAPASENRQRINVPPTSELILPAAAWAANLGLHRADWQTAFDLTADDSPLGLRLHALFSVWRN